MFDPGDTARGSRGLHLARGQRRVGRILEVGPYPPPLSGWSVRIRFVKHRIEAMGHVCTALNIGKSRLIPSEKYVPVRNGLDYILKILWYSANGYTIHMHSNGDAGLKGWLLALWAEIVGFLFCRRSVLSFHAGTHQVFFPRERSGRFTQVLWLLFKLPKLIFCDNDAVREKIREYGIDKGKIRPFQTFGTQYVEHNEAELPRHVESFMCRYDPVVFTYATLRPGYYLDTMADGFRMIRERWPRAGLMFTGALIDSEEPVRTQVTAQLKKTGLGDCVCFADDLSHDQFLTLLGRSRLYLRTPTTDGECASVLESLVLRVPVVAAENYRRPPGVVTYAADDPRDLCEKVCAVLSDHERYRSAITSPATCDTVGEEAETLIRAALPAGSEWACVPTSPLCTGHAAVRVLFLQKRLLFPADTGWRMRTLNILRHLSRWHDITYLCNVGRGEEDYVAPMRALGLHVETVPWRETRHYSAKFYFDLAANLCSRYPYTVAKDYHRKLRQTARRLAAADHFDFLVCDFVQMARNAAGLNVHPKILFQHNVEAQILSRHAANGSGSLRRWYMAIQHRKMRRFEAQAGRQFDAVIAVSQQDRRVFEDAYGWKHVDCIDTAVDVDYFRPQATRAVADRLVFVGSLDWLANEDAVMYFAREIWPAIRAARPGATFQVVGRSPTRRISQLHGIEGIAVAASVPDVRPYLAEAAAVVVPLRVGGGTRIKIFEAFAMGKAVVSTTIGAEGLPLVPGEHLLIADDPGGFAHAVVSLLERPALASELGDRALGLVIARYSAETVARQFDAICRDAVSRVHGDES